MATATQTTPDDTRTEQARELALSIREADITLDDIAAALNELPPPPPEIDTLYPHCSRVIRARLPQASYIYISVFWSADSPASAVFLGAHILGDFRTRKHKSKQLSPGERNKADWDKIAGDLLAISPAPPGATITAAVSAALSDINQEIDDTCSANKKDSTP